MVCQIEDKLLPGVRWSILRTVHVGGYLGATETMIGDVLRSEYLGVTSDCVRDQLAYLEKRELVNLERSELYPWRVTLDRYGQDVVEYQVECDAGVARPPRLGR